MREVPSAGPPGREGETKRASEQCREKGDVRTGGA